MNNKCAFTICASNYIGLAEVLRDSLISKNSDIDFFIVIADEINFVPAEYMLEARSFFDISNDQWYSYAFKYDVTEFCTFLKPQCFLFFQSKGYENTCYFDPDILVFDSLKIVYDHFIEFDFLLTPHLIDLIVDDTDISIEDGLRGSGIYNFGFLGLKTTENTQLFLHWWMNRLKNKCFRDGLCYQFTDQIWGNFILTYFDTKLVKIIRDRGCNVAPWNFCERKVEIRNNNFFVLSREKITKPKPIIFAHYSGYDYVKFLEGEIIQNNSGHISLYEDISLLYEVYKKKLITKKSLIIEYMNHNYSYNHFDNGKKISLFIRRLYRAALFEKIEIGNPFLSSNKLFYKKLKKEKILNYSEKNIEKDFNLNTKKNSNKQIIKISNKIMHLIYRIIGLDKYLMLLKLLKAYGLYENQFSIISKNQIYLWYKKKII